jgi:iduronate 2-sulfatase
VEAVDLFATLSDLASIEVPPLCSTTTEEQLCVEGSSFARLVKAGTSGSVPRGSVSSSTWKTAVFSQYPRPADVPKLPDDGNTDLPDLTKIKVMGYTVREVNRR